MAKPPPKPPRELSLEEAMSSLGVSEKTIRKYIKLKRLKAVKVGKRWFIDEASLDLMRRIVQDEPLVTTAKSATVKARLEAPTAATAMAVHGLACYRLFLAASSQFHFDILYVMIFQHIFIITQLNVDVNNLFLNFGE